MLHLLALILGLSTFAHGNEEIKGLKNESSLGYVITGGNSQSETTNFAQKLSYEWTKDILKFNSHYIQTSGVDQSTDRNNVTAENWSATLRFEKIINPKRFNAYVSYGWYGDRFQGVREGQATDIGGKYYFYKQKALSLHTELGYRYTRELLTTEPTSPVGVGNSIMPEYHYFRTLWQVDYSYSKTFAVGAWVEFLPSVTNFTQDQRINYSPYMTSVLTDIFSLKVAYEARYRFPAAVAGNQLTDFTFTTSILAKF
jgi:putative salt-induced outer membrane protein YdiY